jgi:hypothetical protein
MLFRNRFLSYLLIIIGITVLTGTILYYFNIDQSWKGALVNNIPPMLAGVQLSQVITGEEAIDSIQKLHGKEFPLEDGAVAIYGSRNVILWISDAGDNSDAKELTELMKIRISEGRSPFKEQGKFVQNGITIYELEGLGQQHFYWQSGRLVLWLAADDEFAETALMETIDIYRYTRSGWRTQ